jgi:uncharacterized protein (TIGR03437 family)
MGPAFRRSLSLLALAFLCAVSVHGEGNRSGTTHWGVLNALGRDAQLRLQLRNSYRLFATPSTANYDVGNVAIVPDDGTIIAPANRFDLCPGSACGNSVLNSVTFTPDASGGYRVAAGPSTFDSNLANAGTALVMQDDDAKSIALGFNFPFFGKTYDSVFVNSDGNLTFTAGDVAASPRDLARFLTGVPRIAPFFSDLNPADPTGGRITVATGVGRVTVSWIGVFACCTQPQPSATFQVSLYSDGYIVFAFNTFGPSSFTSAVVGVSPGSFFSTPQMVDFTAQAGSQVITLPIAEVFVPRATLSEPGAARKFFATHEDACDFLILFTNVNADDPTAFAYEINIANDITGIGMENILGAATFDYTSDFGSGGHLSSFVNMGWTAKFPSDPTQVIPLAAPNSTLSVLGQEAGHKWLAHFRYPFGADARSDILLGRDDDHWSFFFNSDASVMEGNLIKDNGNGTFTTTDVVKRYNGFDQYAMGLIPAEQVASSFVVTNPSSAIEPSHAPQSGVSFSGTKLDVTMDKIVQANGPRLPHAAVAPKNFRFAFVLIAGAGTTASTSQIQLVDTIQQAWQVYWNTVTSGRSQIDTQLLRGVTLQGLPAAAVPGTQITARLRAAATDTADRSFALTTVATSGSAASVPLSVTIPAGAREATFQITGTAPGVTRITATASGYGTSEGYVSFTSVSQATLKAVSGDGQLGLLSTALPQPLVVEARDAYSLPVAGITVQFSGSGGVTASPGTAVTDSSGRAQTTATLGAASSTGTVTATASGSTSTPVLFYMSGVGQAVVPAGGAVNAASFAPGAAVTPGSIVAVFGTNLAVAVSSATSLPLQTALGRVSVTINGVLAPLFYVSPIQINLQVPLSVPGSSASLVVNNGVSFSTPISVPLAPIAPGIFGYPTGSQYGAIQHAADYQLVQPSNPARAGETIIIYCTGLGSVNGTIADGQAAPLTPLLSAVTKPQVTIGGQSAALQFWGLTPTAVGLYQVNALVPTGAGSGWRPLVISSGGITHSGMQVYLQ